MIFIHMNLNFNFDSYTTHNNYFGSVGLIELTSLLPNL